MVAVGTTIADRPRTDPGWKCVNFQYSLILPPFAFFENSHQQLGISPDPDSMRMIETSTCSRGFGTQTIWPNSYARRFRQSDT